VLLSVVVLQVLHGWAHSVEVEHLRNQGHVIMMSQNVDMLSRTPVKEAFLVLRWTSRVF
jgi:hypothetical protein